MLNRSENSGNWKLSNGSGVNQIATNQDVVDVLNYDPGKPDNQCVLYSDLKNYQGGGGNFTTSFNMSRFQISNLLVFKRGTIVNLLESPIYASCSPSGLRPGNQTTFETAVSFGGTWRWILYAVYYSESEMQYVFTRTDELYNQDGVTATFAFVIA